jgi:hypothetical protein
MVRPSSGNEVLIRVSYINTPKVTGFEHPSIEVEQFVAMLRFENRGKLAQLPQGLMEVHNGFSSSS